MSVTNGDEEPEVTDPEVTPNIDPAILYSEEGAIGMEVRPGADDMTFDVECVSFQPPWVQPGETAGQVLMTQIQAPAGTTPGVYQNTVKFESIGEQVIICFNGTTRARIRVFAGKFPVWDPIKVYENSVAGRYARRAAQAGAILRTTGKIG